VGLERRQAGDLQFLQYVRTLYRFNSPLPVVPATLNKGLQTWRMACVRAKHIRFMNMVRADASQAVEEAERTERVAADKTAEAFAHVRLWRALSLMAVAMAAGNLGIAESVRRCYTGEVRFTLNRCLCREQAWHRPYAGATLCPFGVSGGAGSAEDFTSLPASRP
jgi:hypothetical protein